MMMERWSKVQSMVEQQYRRLGLGLELMCVEVFLPCVVGGLRHMLQMYG